VCLANCLSGAHSKHSGYAEQVSRPLLAVTGESVAIALRDALSGVGPAIFVGNPFDDMPATVQQRIAVVVQSSGSTSDPKRIALSADAILSSAGAAQSALGAPGQWLLALPTNYIAGINVLARSIACDIEPVALDQGSFSAGSFLAAVARMQKGPRYTSFVPAQLATLLDDAAACAALATFDRILLGGQASPAALLERAASAGLAVTRTYGSSETSGGCIWDGAPLSAVEVRIAIDGEIELSGPVLAEGYLNDPGRTGAAFVDDGARRWYRTGDNGQLIDGLLRVTGRRDDVIISGGVKVSLGEIERVIRDTTPLTDAVVVPVADPIWGDVPVVVATTSMDLGELRHRVTTVLGRAAAPAKIVVMPEIPLLISGKPDRVAVRTAVAR
jgi:o-succinylbenzoate---CoA ligase